MYHGPTNEEGPAGSGALLYVTDRQTFDRRSATLTDTLRLRNEATQ